MHCLNASDKQFDAHCSCLGPRGIVPHAKDHTTPKVKACRMNRVAAKRPLGFLLAWLEQGFCFDNRREHYESRLIITLADRLRCRDWLESQDANRLPGEVSLKILLEKEREWTGGGKVDEPAAID